MSEAEEQMVLVDETDTALGTAGKFEAHREGRLHRAFSVIVWDREGRLLLQKRSIGKYHSGGLWTNACCGHPRPGETAADGAARRLQEEMGFVCPLTGLGTIQYRAELDNGMTEHELVHVFRGVYDGAISPNPEEAEGYQWVSLEALRGDIASSPQRYSAWLKQYMAAEWPMALALPDA